MKDRVLIVDDDPFIVKLLEKVMSSNELETVSAGSGQEALDILAAQSFDVILMDVMLGDMFRVLQIFFKVDLVTAEGFECF